MSFQRPTQIPTQYPVSTPYTFTALAPPSFPSRPGSSILIDCRSSGSLRADDYAHRRISKGKRRCPRQLITFDMLPDDVLLEIFDFYVREDMHRIEEWIKLSHVCRRWKSVVFQSPHRLNLQLSCTPKTPRDMLDIWPPLPLIIHDLDRSYFPVISLEGNLNIIAALEHNDRVCQIKLIYAELGDFTNSAAILKPFPELTSLQLRNFDQSSHEKPEPILPDLFLGGSAPMRPRLRSIQIDKVSFPALPKLLSSATHLVDLHLTSIPRSGYIPPAAMATGLSALTNLEYLRLRFDYPPPRPALTRHPPPLTHFILPSLTRIEFKGASEYLEAILTRIDAPRLDRLDISFFNQLIFNTPQLFQFINRRPALRASVKGHIEFFSDAVTVGFPSQISHFHVLNVRIRCTSSEWQLSSLEQVCASSLPPGSTLEDLYISEFRYERPDWQDNVENTLWLDLLRLFVAVKNLYISEEFVPRIAPALQELVGGRTTEVLPALDNIFLEEFQSLRPLHEGIVKFVAARQLTSRPVTISRWDWEGEGLW